eukprot:PhM_4_TR13205/c0_g1_i1/m.53110
MFAVLGSPSPSRDHDSTHSSTVPGLDLIDEQFRRAALERRNTETELHELRRKLESKEQLVESLKLDVQRAREAAAAGGGESPSRHHYDPEASAVLFHQIPELKAEVESERQRRKDLEAMLVSEKQRIEQQMEDYHSTMGRRLVDTERERDRLSSLLLQREQELAVKDSELRNSLRENANVREDLEKVAHDLVERNKRRDEASERRCHEYEEEICRVKGEQMRLVQESKELRDQLSRARNECMILSTQCETAQGINQDVTVDLHTAQETANDFAQKLNDAEAESARKDETIAVLREENEGLLERIERLETAIRQKSEEDIVEAEKYAQVRLQYATLEDEAVTLRQEKDGFAHKVVGMSEQLYDEVRKVLREVDSARESFAEVTGDRAMSLGNTTQQQRHHDNDDDLPMEPMDTAEQVEEYLARSVDRLVVVWEEVHALKMDTRHEIMRREEYGRQAAVMREAYDVDHAHIADLNGQIEQLRQELSAAHRETSSVKESMHDAERWMDEALRCTEEQKFRNEQLMVEKERLQTEVASAHAQTDAMRLTFHEREVEMNAMKAQSDKLARELWEIQRQKVASGEETNRLRDSVATMRSDMEAIARNLKRSQDECSDLREKADAADTDARCLKQQISEEQAQRRECESELIRLQNEVKKLREAATKSQRTLIETNKLNTASASPGGTDAALKDLLREKEGQVEQLRRQRDDADMKALRLTEENARLRSRLDRDAQLGGVSPSSSARPAATRVLTSAERVRDLESRVSTLLSSRELDSWRFKQ